MLKKIKIKLCSKNNCCILDIIFSWHLNNGFVINATSFHLTLFVHEWRVRCPYQTNSQALSDFITWCFRAWSANSAKTWRFIYNSFSKTGVFNGFIGNFCFVFFSLFLFYRCMWPTEVTRLWATIIDLTLFFFSLSGCSSKKHEIQSTR